MMLHVAFGSGRRGPVAVQRGRMRREIFAVICQDIARVQFQLDTYIRSAVFPAPASFLVNHRRFGGSTAHQAP
jgi:hypothetical protein